MTGAVLWDMDGTLLDSEECHWLAWQETMAAEGRVLTPEQFQASFGQRNDIVLRGFYSRELPPAEVSRIAEAKEAAFRALLRHRGAKLFPGAARCLDWLRAQGWPQAVASSAPRANVETVLSVLNLSDYFAAVVVGEDVRRGKPDPEVFLLAAQRLGVPPCRCLVVEDVEAGVEAARRAGMRSLAVRHTRPQLSGDCTAASLADLPEDAFLKLLDSDCH